MSEDIIRYMDSHTRYEYAEKLTSLRSNQLIKDLTKSRTKYSDGIKENQTCPPDNEVWLLPNTCIEDDHMCRPNDNTVSILEKNGLPLKKIGKIIRKITVNL